MSKEYNLTNDISWLEYLKGKTIQNIVIDYRPTNDITIYFTDGSMLSIECNGDDMSYTDIVYQRGS